MYKKSQLTHLFMHHLHQELQPIKGRNVILWTCECEHEQVNPNESFQEYHVDVDGIFFGTWDGIFCDVEKYSTMWQWMNDILGW